jgi:hypothetical protein
MGKGRVNVLSHPSRHIGGIAYSVKSALRIFRAAATDVLEHAVGRRRLESRPRRALIRRITSAERGVLSTRRVYLVAQGGLPADPQNATKTRMEGYEAIGRLLRRDLEPA